MIIVGAGMAGLLAAQMLRRHAPVVREAQAALPDNHGALLRFRSDAVARATGIPFRSVRVRKAIKSRDGHITDRATLQDNNAYSLKVTGAVEARSVLDLAPCDRFIAPSTFLADLARSVTIALGTPFARFDLAGRTRTSDPVISTMPMPLLMEMAKWPTRPTFRSQRIGALTVELAHPAVDVFQTIYYPWSESYYRASLTGSRLIIEFIEYEPDDPEMHEWSIDKGYIDAIMEDFGIGGDWEMPEGVFPSYQSQQYGKLLPIPERERRAFILAMTEEYHVYSLGRFATWRQLLLDDVVGDVRVVESMIDSRDDYARARLRV